MLECSIEFLCCSAEILDFHEDCSRYLFPFGVESGSGADTWLGRCNKIMNSFEDNLSADLSCNL